MWVIMALHSYLPFVALTNIFFFMALVSLSHEYKHIKSVSYCFALLHLLLICPEDIIFFKTFLVCVQNLSCLFLDAIISFFVVFIFYRISSILTCSMVFSIFIRESVTLWHFFICDKIVQCSL